MILDSNIIIYSVKPEYIRLARYLQDYPTTIYVSLISMLEVLDFSRLSPSDKRTFEAYLNSVAILPLPKDVIMEAIRLR